LQGFSVIPGLSRSGITLFGLLNRGFDQEKALETSFLLSVPVVLAANAYLALNGFQFRPEYLVSVAVAFVAGILSMHFLLALARKIDFSWFCWFFGVLCFSAFLAFL
jgi:undecaprenyl-diphosphatase